MFLATRTITAAGTRGFELQEDVTGRKVRRNLWRNGLAVSLDALTGLTYFIWRIRSEGPHYFQVSFVNSPFSGSRFRAFVG
jgi:hypothetical protein